MSRIGILECPTLQHVFGHVAPEFLRSLQQRHNQATGNVAQKHKIQQAWQGLVQQFLWVTQIDRPSGTGTAQTVRWHVF
jgi:hypothetical protein